MAFEDEAESYYFEQCENPVVYDYPNGRELVFTKLYTTPRKITRGKRGKVKTLSAAAVRRFRQSIRRFGGTFTHFVTITFPPELGDVHRDGWRGYVRYFWQELAAECRARSISYIWVREPHKDGRPHYHVLCEKGVMLRLLAHRINAKFLAPERAQQNLRHGLQCKAIYPEGGAARYMSKLASYCSKESEVVREESYRHWARNYEDYPPEPYEANAAVCDWLRSRYYLFYAFKFPLVVSVPKNMALGPPLPW